uniref:Thioredoxin domain-containing protein n=1 Tax=viral metagenome TaxID=1070528 RepID=A0A6C0H2L4_9ZZZZ
MERLCVLLYSKYSPMSNKLMSALSSCPVDLGSTVGLNPVCIDNEDVRKRLLKNGKIELSIVPCVLIVYRSGGVEKYEGNAAFQWIEEAVSKYAPPPPPPPPPMPQPQPQPPNQEVHQPKKRVSISKQKPVIEEYEEYEEEEEPEPIKKVKPVRHSKKETTMEELGFESLDDQDQKSTESNDNASVKTRDLMTAASAMQKEREVVDSTKLKYGTNIVTNKRPV